MTVWRVLFQRLSSRPYKFQLPQDLGGQRTNERPRRRDFCTDMPKHLEGDSLLLDRIVFSGEATFQLSGKVNRHNIVIWGSQNPHQIVEHVRES